MDQADRMTKLLGFGKYFRSIFSIIRYGPLFLSSGDVWEVVTTLARLVQLVDVGHPWWRVGSDLAVGIYYRLAESRGERYRTVENKNFRPISEIFELERFCLLSVRVGYETDILQAQRLLRHQGLSLILGETKDTLHFFIAGSRIEKSALLILPGTRGIADVTVDMNAFEVDVDGDGKGHAGIVAKARRIVLEVGPVLEDMSGRGYKIFIIGHSLGGGVAALTTAFLRKRINRLQCYTFGSPPCVNQALGSALESCVTSVVLRDDLVARATVGNVERLFIDLCTDETRARVRRYLADDLSTISQFQEFFKRRVREDISAPPVKVESYLAKSKQFFLTMLDRLSLTRQSAPQQNFSDNTREFFLPGKVVHLTSRNGVFVAEYVARHTLNRIETQVNMLKDHLGESYVKAVSQAAYMAGNSPVTKVCFTPFPSAETCMRCGSNFLWNSVLKGEPHVFLAKHWCRKCGCIVCSACSSNARSLPEVGHLFPVRHCDKCWLAPYKAKL